METILFLIIAGILSTIFGKSKGKSTSGRTKPFAPKGLDDFRTMVDQQIGRYPRKTGSISMGQPVEEKFDDIGVDDQQLNSVSPRMPLVPAKPEVSSRIEVETVDTQFEKPDAKTIINGIIWAEILGEPRAKRPYTTKNR
ncbi:hypothetical protein V7124_06255 [Neobacillus niacini]|uniref:hypothetical protein n=1 Tax=Neobacillus niacini TaxID=86668 RepID=UPI002FFDDC58